MTRPTGDALRQLCAGDCGAQCCRGPAYLRLTPAEAERLRAHAARLGVPLTLKRTLGDGMTMNFPDHEGDRCPMLDSTTLECRIYDERPERCRAFPEAPRPGCALSTMT